MKIKPEHLAEIETAFRKVDPAKIEAHRAFIKAEGKSMNPEKRLRWDLLSATLGSAFLCNYLYPYANDTHIDTALRAVMEKLENNLAE